jgi:hypothetical protein
VRGISVHVSPELQAMLTRIRELPTEVRKQIRVATKTDALPIWQQTIGANVETRAEALAFGRTARVAVTDRGVRLQAARVGKTLSGGLSVKTQWQGLEFGADPKVVRKVETTSRKGTSYTAVRHTQRQLRPRKSSGYVVFPAVAESIPRLMSLWLQTVARAGHEALEGKR